MRRVVFSFDERSLVSLKQLEEQGRVMVMAKTPVIETAPVDTWQEVADSISNSFCPTGEGGGVDPHCSPSKTASPKKTLKSLKRDNIVGVDSLKSAASIGHVKMHGMTNPEKMMAVKVDGIEVVFNEKTVAAAHETLINSKAVHPTLWKQNKSIVFSSQEDSKAAAIAKQNGLTKFESAASGGDGHIVVYGGRSMTTETLAHESAHNLALNTWGKGKPDVFDKKYNFTADRKVKMQGMQQRVSNAVTEYGQWSPEEDFAEFVTAYNEIMVRGKTDYRGATEKSLKKRPKGLGAIKKLLGD